MDKVFPPQVMDSRTFILPVWVCFVRLFSLLTPTFIIEPLFSGYKLATEKAIFCSQRRFSALASAHHAVQPVGYFGLLVGAKVTVGFHRGLHALMPLLWKTAVSASVPGAASTSLRCRTISAEFATAAFAMNTM